MSTIESSPKHYSNYLYVMQNHLTSLNINMLIGLIVIGSFTIKYVNGIIYGNYVNIKISRVNTKHWVNLFD